MSGEDTKKIVLGCRASAVGIAQAKAVSPLLEAAGFAVEIRGIKTVGDMLDVTLAETGGAGVFVREIDEAIASGGVDVAVYGMEEVPVQMSTGVALAAVGARVDAREAFISTVATRFMDLPKGARVGVSGMRRQMQLLALRPDIEIVELKGDLHARLKQLEGGDADALVLDAAGLVRLSVEKVITEALAVDRVVPAAGQGALAILVKSGDKDFARAIFSACHHRATGVVVRAERAFLRALGDATGAPMGGNAEIKPSGIELIGMLGTPDGMRFERERESGPVEEAAEIGKRLAKTLKDKLSLN